MRPKISLKAPAREKETAEEVLQPEAIQPAFAPSPSASVIGSMEDEMIKKPTPTGTEIARPRNCLVCQPSR